MHEGSIIVPSVSVKAYTPCLVDSVSYVHLVSSTLWFLQSFLPFFLSVPQVPPYVWVWVSAYAPIKLFLKISVKNVGILITLFPLY